LVLALAQRGCRRRTFLLEATAGFLLGFNTGLLFEQLLSLFLGLATRSFDRCPLTRYLFGSTPQSFFFRAQTLLLNAAIVFRSKADLLFSDEAQSLLLDKLARFFLSALAGFFFGSLANRFFGLLSQLFRGATICFLFRALASLCLSSFARCFLSIFACGLSHGSLAREFFGGASQGFRFHAEARLFFSSMPGFFFGGCSR
jgi:hypothetical protein